VSPKKNTVLSGGSNVQRAQGQGREGGSQICCRRIRLGTPGRGEEERSAIEGTLQKANLYRWLALSQREKNEKEEFNTSLKVGFFENASLWSPRWKQRLENKTERKKRFLIERGRGRWK